MGNRDLHWLVLAALFAATTVGPGIRAEETTRGWSGKVVGPGDAKVGDHWLLLIAIDEYDSEYHKRLSCAVGDAEAVREVLLQRYTFRPERVKPLYNANATLENIDSELRRIAKETKPTDSVLIYYAGHGAKDELTQKGSWIPVDATRRPTTYLRNSDIKDIIANMTAMHVLLISDSCFSGNFISRGDGEQVTIDEKYYRNVFGKQSRQVITSGGDEPVADGQRGGRSPFAYWLVKKLSSNQQRYLVPSELIAKIATGVARDSNQTPDMSHFLGAHDEAGEFVFILREGDGRTNGEDDDEISGDRGRAVGTLHVKCTQKDADVWCGSKHVGTTRARMETLVVSGVAIGKHVVTATKEGFLDRQREYEVKEGEPVEVNIVLERIPRTLGGDIYFNARDGSTMVKIPAGDFTMGSEEEGDEKPVDSVFLPAFYISKHEITNRQMAKFLADRQEWARSRIKSHYDNGEYLSLWEDGGCPPELLDHPVAFVSWFAAKAYCEWAGGRLPSEAEWEKAARGDKGRRYPWGDEWSPSRCNSADRRGDAESEGTVPVGQFPTGVSPYGVFDMAGNVWEWVSSQERSYPYNALDGREDLSESRAVRVLRGGAWNWFADSCRTTNRHGDLPLFCGADTGFRLCIDARGRSPR